MVPNAGLTLNEEMGLSSKDDRFSRTDGTHLGTGDQPLSQSMNQFNRLEQYANAAEAARHQVQGPGSRREFQNHL